MATNINNKLVCNEPHASLDSYYGPYNSVHDAYTALADTTVNGVNYTKKYIGLTVGVWKDSNKNEIIEYWFKGGLQEGNLVEKTSGGGGLPENIKIVTFDKNGGEGVQNSIITDTSSKAMLPECTLTNPNGQFSKWSYGGVEYMPGDVITIGTSTVVTAIWETHKEQYKVQWADKPHATITGKDSRGNTINSHSSYDAGTVIILTANVAEGYVLNKWVSIPDGSTVSGNTLTFTLNANTGSISVEVHEDVKKHKLEFNIDPEAGEKVTKLICTVNRKQAESGSQYPEGSIVEATAIMQDGFYPQWTVVPEEVEYTLSKDGKTLTCTLTTDTALTINGTDEPGAGFWYSGVTTPDEFDKDKLEEIVGTKWNIAHNKSKCFYMVTRTDVAPIIYKAGNKETKQSFSRLNKDAGVGDDLINRFVEERVIRDDASGMTGEALEDKGEWIWIFIDNDDLFVNLDVIISIEKE